MTPSPNDAAARAKITFGLDELQALKSDAFHGRPCAARASTGLAIRLLTIDSLMTPSGFKQAFDGGREADEGFYAFANQMSDDTPEYRQIILNLEMLAKQIEFVLHNYTMDDERLFGFFKRLELMLLTLRRSPPGYDESKPLCRFINEIFSGWNFVEGDRGYDIIEKMIADI